MIGGELLPLPRHTRPARTQSSLVPLRGLRHFINCSKLPRSISDRVAVVELEQNNEETPARLVINRSSWGFALCARKDSNLQPSDP